MSFEKKKKGLLYQHYSETLQTGNDVIVSNFYCENL